ncbi:MAG: tRNA anti-like [Schlesneria sp.]|jgi:hypothetical protein|nr:tRNA anti-like [Schlesneria sp.]
MRHQTFAAILFAVVASLTGCESAKAPPPLPPRPPASQLATPTTPDASNMTQETVAEVADEPEIKVSAEQIAKDYSTEPAAAGVKYTGKFFRIEGKIHKLEITKDGVRTLILEGHGGLDIHCIVGAQSWTLYKSLKVDQNVSVVGKVYGVINNAVSVSAEQIDR